MHFESKNLHLCFPMILSFQCLVGFLFEGVGGVRKNDHEFPFLRTVELFERSLSKKMIAPQMKSIQATEANERKKDIHALHIFWDMPFDGDSLHAFT